MASNYIKVNTSALKNDARDLNDMAEQSKKQLREMHNAVMALDKMWDGPANQAFVNQFRNDYELLDSLCNSVKAFSKDLTEAAREYDKCEDSVESAVRAIRV